MTRSASRGPRRSDALSRDRIAEAAVELLDTAGEHGLTVRALSTHLATGRGAIYHHIANMDELLAMATDRIIEQVMAGPQGDADPKNTIRAHAMGIFDAIDAHPWVGTQLSREPLQPAAFRIWKGFGSQLLNLGVPGSGLSNAGSALVSYVLGSAAQYAAGARRVAHEADRGQYLQNLAAQWAQWDSDAIALQAASALTEHDDREQFRAGVEIFLAGITTSRQER